MENLAKDPVVSDARIQPRQRRDRSPRPHHAKWVAESIMLDQIPADAVARRVGLDIKGDYLRCRSEIARQVMSIYCRCICRAAPLSKRLAHRCRPCPGEI